MAGGGAGGVCICLTAELKRHPGPLPASLSAATAKLRKLTSEIREAPDVAAHYYARATHLLSMKMFAEAALDAEACLRLEPSFSKARFAKGRALYFLGEFDAAFEQCDEMMADFVSRRGLVMTAGTFFSYRYDAGLRTERNPKIETWLAAERRKPE